MRQQRFISVLMLIFVLVLAAPAVAQQKPFTQAQVQGLVQDGIGDQTGASLIAQRGIDFVPTEDFLQSLKAAGANAAFLQALRTAKRPQPTGGGASKPLTQIQVLSLVAGEVPNERVAILVQQRGIDFDPSDEFFQELRRAGGNDELIGAIKNAKVTYAVILGPALQANQKEIRQHTARGAELLRTKQYADAESEYRAAVQLDPQNADLHISLGMALGYKGDWDGQIAEDREAVRLSPNDDRAHIALGAALWQKDDQQVAAIAEYREAIRLNPNNDLAHLYLGNRLMSKGDGDGASAEYHEAARLNPKNVQAYIGLANLCARNKDWDGAIEEYREALQVNPNNDATYVGLGALLSQKGDQDGAIAEYREAIRLNPQNQLAHLNLGNRLTAKNDWDGAFAEYSEAVRLNANSPVAHYSLGTAYEHQGNRPAALQEYRTAYDLNPKMAIYQKAVERLSSQGN